VAIRLDVPRIEITIHEDDPATGPASAPIVVVEFADFQCPYCGQLTPVMKRIVATYGDRVRLVWKDFPLPNHPDAMPAAEAAQCARDQGQFWAYHDRLFDNQDTLSLSNLKQWAADLGMDANRFNACVDAGTHRGLIEADVEEGNGYGVASTPTVFINGRAVVGAVPYESFAEIIEEELAR
jgi:protein-disulfide isomerase